MQFLSSGGDYATVFNYTVKRGNFTCKLYLRFFKSHLENLLVPICRPEIGLRNLHFNWCSVTSYTGGPTVTLGRKRCPHSKAHPSLYEQIPLTAASARASRKRAKDAGLSPWAVSQWADLASVPGSASTSVFFMLV